MCFNLWVSLGICNTVWSSWYTCCVVGHIYEELASSALKTMWNTRTFKNALVWSCPMTTVFHPISPERTTQLCCELFWCCILLYSLVAHYPVPSILLFNVTGKAQSCQSIPVNEAFNCSEKKGSWFWFSLLWAPHKQRKNSTDTQLQKQKGSLSLLCLKE